MKTQIFEMKARILWGDWGDTLLNARAIPRKARTEPISISRFGPYVPPLCETATTILVDTETRLLIEGVCSAKVWFREAVYRDVYELHWHLRDFHAPAPKRVPRRGGPSGYYRMAVRAPELIDRMEPSWELCRQSVEGRFFRGAGYTTADPKLVLHLTPAAYEQVQDVGVFGESFADVDTMVTDGVREWFEASIPEWVRFRPVPYKVMERHLWPDKRGASEAAPDIACHD